MCEFISWKEFDGGYVLFLTAKDIYETKRGRELQEYSGSEDDLTGHGAIDFFYDLKGKGKNKECTDFSTPDNFPPAIVRAIKAGEFRGLGIAKELLTAPAWAKYEKVTDSALAEYEKVKAPAKAKYEKVEAPAWAEYNKVTDSAWAKYEKVKAPAWAEYNKVTDSALAEFEKVMAPARAKYEKVTAPAKAKYKKVTASAWAEYKKVTASAWAEYNKVGSKTFWDLFAVRKNRAKKWR